MKDFLVFIVGSVFVVLLVLFGSYEAYNYFAPKYVATDNKVFHESQAYNDGMIRDLEDLKLQYVQATPEQKLALRATVLHRFSVYPREKLPFDLREFYTNLESN